MTKEEIVEIYNIEDGVIFFEPSEVFNKGIIGVTEDKCHIVYSFEKLLDALTNDYEEEWNKINHLEIEEKPDFFQDALEWLDFNTLNFHCGSEYEPIIIYEIKE